MGLSSGNMGDISKIMSEGEEKVIEERWKELKVVVGREGIAIGTGARVLEACISC